MDIIFSGIFERTLPITLFIYNWFLKFLLSSGCKFILLEKYTNLLFYNLCSCASMLFQAILMSMCLQSMVDELIMKKQGKKMKKVTTQIQRVNCSKSDMHEISYHQWKKNMLVLFNIVIRYFLALLSLCSHKIDQSRILALFNKITVTMAKMQM